MESYIEVTWLSGFMMLVQAGTLAFYLINKPCDYRRILIYSVCMPMLACVLFHPLEWIVMAGVEGMFAYWIFAYAWKGWLLMITQRLLLNLTAYVLYGGSFHLGIWFVPCASIPWLLWGVLFLSWAMMFFYLKYRLSQQDFIYPIEIAAKQSALRMKGYLDSGNLMMSEGVPILFVDSAYETYFDGTRIQWVISDTIQGSTRLPCHPARVRIKNAPYHDVLICCKQKLTLPLGAKALLSIHMMTQE